MADEKATVIDAQADVEGKLKGKDAVVYGRFRGEIALSGRLVLGEGARVEATVSADAAEVAGEMKGDLRARSVTLTEKARVQGTVDARVLVVREGAWLSGSVSAGEGASKGAAAPAPPPPPPPDRGRGTQGGRVKLRELAARLGCELRGDGEVEIAGVAPIEQAGPGDVTFLANPRYASHLATTRAGAVILAPGQAASLPCLVSDNPYLAFARAVALVRPPARPAPGVHPSAQVDPSAVLGADVHVGALAVVGAGVRVGARSALHPHVVLYEGVVVGEDCVIHSGVQVRERCRLGSRVVVQNGAVIGGDGFGFARDREGRYHKFPQVGIVVVEDDVEIGALDRHRPGRARRDPHRPGHEARQPGAGGPLGHDRRGHGDRRTGRHRGQHAHRQPGHPGRAGGRRRAPDDRRRGDRHRPDGHPRLRGEGLRDLGLPRDREPRVAQVDRGLRPAARAAEAPARAGAEGRVAARPAALRA